MSTKPKKDSRPQRYGWAPGKYLNDCPICAETFIGDKHASLCADCAYALSEPVTTSEAPPTPSELDRLRAENAELRKDRERLLLAIGTLQKAKGRHNTGTAYQRLMDLAAAITATEQGAVSDDSDSLHEAFSR